MRRVVKKVNPNPSPDPQATGTEAKENFGRFPASEVHSLLKHFRSIFDEKQAKKGMLNLGLGGSYA